MHYENNQTFEPTTAEIEKFQQSERVKGWLALFGVGLAVLVLFSSFVSLA